MIKYCIVIFMFSSLLISVDVAEDLTFLSIPGSARSNSLGNSITSSNGQPNSLLLSPANIWDDSKYALTTTTRSLSVAGVNYSNIFYSWKPRIFTKIVDRTCIGIVIYGVNGIEEYNDEAIFQNYFKFNNTAFLYGISKRTLGIDVGLGVKYINKSFSIDKYSNNYFGIDLGITLQDFLSTVTNSYFKPDFTISYAMNKVIPLSNDNQSMTKITLGVSKMVIENYYFQLINSKLKIKFHSDVSKFNYSPNIRNRTGIEVKFKYSEIIGISTNWGYNGLVKSIDTLDLDEFKEIDDVWSTGIFIDLFSNEIKIFNNSSRNLIVNFGKSWKLNNSETIAGSGYLSLNVKWFNN